MSLTPRERAGRVLLVISAQPQPDLRERIAAGMEPRRDYFEMQQALGEADLLLPADVWADPRGRRIAGAAGLRAGLAWLAFQRRRDYDAIYSDGEGVGLPLAALLKLSGRARGRPRHVMLTHYLSPAKKQVWFRLGVQTHLDAVICHASAQRELLVTRLRMPPERVHLLPYFADERFWRPRFSSAAAGGAAGVPQMPLHDAPEFDAAGADRTSPRERVQSGGGERAMICAVGLEFRDNDTLVAAARGLGANVDVEIAAASHWSHHSAFANTPTLPPNVHIASYDYVALRELYARARFVVVPLREVDNQAGITVILEAMSMGKAVIVSGTRGQTDVVRDRRNGGRGRMPRQWWPGFVDAPDLAETVGRLPTGFFVTPGDAGELQRAISYLLAHPDVATELGRNGRRVVDACFGLDAFAARFAAVIHGGRMVAQVQGAVAAGA